MSTNISFQEVIKWSDKQCRDYLEKMRWSNNPRCPKCNADNPYTITRRTETKNKVKSIYKCRKCKRQFTATVGTIFEDSHIPLSTWFASIFLMCASKKGISAHQIHRQLGITYKSAWFMCHRIREAMRDKGILSPLSGTIEADETFIGGKTRGDWTLKERIQDEIKMGIREKHRHPRMDKAVVLGMLERNGKVRTKQIKEMNSATAHQLKDSLPHDVIKHEIEYVNGDIHTNTIDGFWSLVKRGITGVYHSVSPDYLQSYINEYSFRYNHREDETPMFQTFLNRIQPHV